MNGGPFYLVFRIGSLKAELVRRVLRDYKQGVLLMDTDIVFLRDPRRYLLEDETAKARLIEGSLLYE